MRWRTVRATMILLTAATLGAACATPPNDPQVPLSAVTPDVATAPVPPVETQYVIKPGDALAVKFYYHPEADVAEVVVRTDGKLTLPLIGTVPAAGLTPTQLAGEITPLYAKNLRDPKIDVTVKSMSDSRIYVGGEVQRPGFVQYKPGMTALQAVVEAGGFKDTAQLAEVVLLQPAGQEKYRTSTLNLAQVVEQGNTTHNVLVGPSDVLFVPKTGLAKADQWVDQYIVKMLPVRLGIGVRAP